MNLIMTLSIWRRGTITRVDIGQLKAICDEGICHVIAGSSLLSLLLLASSSLLLVHDCHGYELAVFGGRKSIKSLASKEAGRLLQWREMEGSCMYEALMVEQSGRYLLLHSGGNHLLKPTYYVSPPWAQL